MGGASCHLRGGLFACLILLNINYMKKLFFIIFVALLFPSLSFATSGACSYHGGVNCSVGSSAGYAQCNDGTVSSVLYSAMVECSIPTTPPFCIAPSQYDYKYTSTVQCSGLSVQQAQNGSSRYTPETASGAISDCYNQVAQYQTAQLAYQTCLNSKTTYTPPTFSADTSCKLQFGSHSVPSTNQGYCSCDAGYKFDSDKQCVLTPTTTLPACTVDKAAWDSANKEADSISQKILDDAKKVLDAALNRDPNANNLRIAHEVLVSGANTRLTYLQGITRCGIKPVATSTPTVGSCATQYGAYSVSSTTAAGICTCQFGYYFSTSTPEQCIPVDEYYCHIFGTNSVVNKDKSINKECVLRHVPTAVPLPSVKAVTSQKVSNPQQTKSVVAPQKTMLVASTTVAVATTSAQGTLLHDSPAKRTWFQKVGDFIWNLF